MVLTNATKMKVILDKVCLLRSAKLGKAGKQMQLSIYILCKNSKEFFFLLIDFSSFIYIEDMPKKMKSKNKVKSITYTKARNYS